MSDDIKRDPFKPQQPAIPGVSLSDQKPRTDPLPLPEFPGTPQQKKPFPVKLVAIAGGVALVVIVGLLYWGRKSNSRPMSVIAASTAAAPVGSATVPKTAAALPLGPGPIATTDDLAKTWSAKRFLFRNSVTGQPQPAMVVHLPHGEYWGFSLVEPFGNCELEYITDLKKLQADYHYQADHPMVVDSCNRTVYDLLRYDGGASNDDLVRGVIVQGTGLRPPMAIEIRTKGKEVLALREE